MVAPRLHRPGGPLAGHVEYFGHLDGPGHPLRDRALARGAVTVIFDLGAGQLLDVFAADGHTPVRVPPAIVMGPHVSSYVYDVAPHSTMLAIHFLPGGAASFLPVPLGHLEHEVVGVEHVWGRDGLRLHQRLIETPGATARFALLEEFLSARVEPSARAADVATALRAVERSPAITITELRALTGLSAKRLIARFRSEVGLAPKAYARVRRFQAALRRVRAGNVHGAEIAATVGYFDQAHFIREFRAFTSMTPSQYAQRPLWLPSHVSLAG